MLNNAPARKACQDNEVKCDKCDGPWERSRRLGCPDLLLFHHVLRRGRAGQRLGVSPLAERSEVDMQITVTWLRLGPRLYFLTKQFKITHSARQRLQHE